MKSLWIIAKLLIRGLLLIIARQVIRSFFQMVAALVIWLFQLIAGVLMRTLLIDNSGASDVFGICVVLALMLCRESELLISR